MSIISIQKKLNLKQDGVLGPISTKAIADYYKLNILQASHFLGQCAHETGDWRLFKENLNYSANGLLKTWPSRFDTKTAKEFERKPELIANRVYSNRMGNGDEASGDGFKFIGRGAIQLTGRSNYTEFAKSINDLSVLDNPDIILTEYILESAKWFFDKNNLWRLCTDTSDKTIETITRRINGGTHGLADRKEKTLKYYNWLNR